VCSGRKKERLIHDYFPSTRPRAPSGERFGPTRAGGEIDAALSAACTAQASLAPDVDPGIAVNLLRKAWQRCFVPAAEAYSELITLEMGKPIVEAEAENRQVRLEL